MDRLEKWRLILGQQADPEEQVPLQGAEQQGMDKVLEALYDSDRKGGLGSSSPKVNRWLGDIRQYFPAPVVQVMQKDALERLQLQKMLLEPELLSSMEPDPSLVATLLTLNKVMPQKTKETAREVVAKVVKAIEERLAHPLREAVRGALHRSSRNRRPRLKEMDWHRTIRANLKHYNPDIPAFIPEHLWGYGRRGQSLRHIMLLLDQSGSMAESVVYAAVFGAVLASLRSVETRLIAFDTQVVDLSEHLHDPVELLFAAQLGGGTDINGALTYAEKLVRQPEQTILILISDLFEGGNASDMLKRTASLKASGVHMIVLLALDDQGAPAYDHRVAAQLAAMDIPSFACTPQHFPDLMTAAIQKEDLREWAARQGVAVK